MTQYSVFSAVLASLVQSLVLSALRVALPAYSSVSRARCQIRPSRAGTLAGRTLTVSVGPLRGPQSLLIVDLFIAAIAKMAIDAIKRTRATALAILRKMRLKERAHIRDKDRRSANVDLDQSAPPIVRILLTW